MFGLPVTQGRPCAGSLRQNCAINGRVAFKLVCAIERRQCVGLTAGRRNSTATNCDQRREVRGLGAGCLFKGLFGLRNQRRARRQDRAEQIVTHVRDPDAVDEDTESPDKEPPNAFWRVMAAFMYMIPWIDAVGLGREVYHKFPVFVYLYYMTGPFAGIYFCSQFAPLVVFFLMYLSIVKNNKLSHFVRFNCMQAIMLDIVVMLFTILHSYFPAELRWSWVLSVFDSYSWVASMATVLYCVFFTLKGRYADLPYVSESVYIQVETSEYA